MSRVPKGSKRPAIEVARMRASLLANGWKQMLARHEREKIAQHNKMLEARQEIERLEQENESE